MTSKCGKNKKVEHKAQMSVSLMFLLHFVILCDLLQNSPTARWTDIINNTSSHSSPYARQYSPSTPWFNIIVTSDKCISSCHELIHPQSVDKSIMHYYLQQVHNSWITACYHPAYWWDGGTDTNNISSNSSPHAKQYISWKMI